MGQVYSNESGSVKAYALPEVPGGIVGSSAALAVAQGARTPGDIAALTLQNLFFSFVGIAIMFLIVGGALYVYSGGKAGGLPVIKKEPFTAPVDESDERCADFP